MGITNTVLKLKSYFDAWHSESKNSHIDLIYPVGSIYMSVNDTNPKTFFGGQWTKIEGRFLLGSGIVPEDKTKQYITNDIGGSKNAIIPKHNHKQQAHTHTQNEHQHNSYRYDDGFQFLLSDGNIAVNHDNRVAAKETANGYWHYVYSKPDRDGWFGDIIESNKTIPAVASNNNTDGGATIIVG